MDFAQARYYNNQHGRFASVDPLLASARTTQPQSWNRYVYCWNSPMKLVDPDGMDVVALDRRAQELIILTLPSEVREKVQAAFDKGKGTLSRNALNRIGSDDENFMALKTLVNSKEITEAATASVGNNGVTFFDTTVGERSANDLKNYKASNPNASKEELDRLFPPPSDPTAREAYLGQTFSPNGEDGSPASPSGHLRAVVTDASGPAARVSEEEQVATMAHELYGHSYHFRTGNKTWKGEGPAMDAIEQRARKNYRDGEVKKQSPGNLKPKQ